jgi:hypothetical protein
MVSFLLLVYFLHCLYEPLDNVQRLVEILYRVSPAAGSVATLKSKAAECDRAQIPLPTANSSVNAFCAGVSPFCRRVDPFQHLGVRPRDRLDQRELL